MCEEVPLVIEAWIIGYEVVNDDESRLAVYEEADAIDASFVLVAAYKAVHNNATPLRKYAQRGDEVVIANLALTHPV